MALLFIENLLNKVYDTTLRAVKVASVDSNTMGESNVTIPNGQATSDGVNLNGAAVIRVNCPAAWTAANLGAEVSMDNVTWRRLHNSDGSIWGIGAGASRSVIVNPQDLPSVKYIRLLSQDSSGVLVNQGGARTIGIVIRQL